MIMHIVSDGHVYHKKQWVSRHPGTRAALLEFKSNPWTFTILTRDPSSSRTLSVTNPSVITNDQYLGIQRYGSSCLSSKYALGIGFYKTIVIRLIVRYEYVSQGK